VFNARNALDKYIIRREHGLRQRVGGGRTPSGFSNMIQI